MICSDLTEEIKVPVPSMSLAGSLLTQVQNDPTLRRLCVVVTSVNGRVVVCMDIWKGEVGK